MIEVNDFTENYSRAIKIIEGKGFKNPVLFKGFSKEERHNFNLLIEDKGENKSPITHRKLSLKEELTDLLNCKVVVTLKKQMEEYYLKKLDASNSVSLREASLSLKEISRVFGEDWKFNGYNKSSADTFWKKQKEGSPSQIEDKLHKELSTLPAHKQNQILERLCNKRGLNIQKISEKHSQVLKSNG